MEELFYEGKRLGNRMKLLTSVVQNEGVKFDYMDIAKFGVEVESLIEDIGNWKKEVIKHMKENGYDR